MAYDEKLADRIREALVDAGKVEEKTMFGGICFMLNDKMCVGVSKEEMMCRIDPEKYEMLMEKPGTREMNHNGRIAKGIIFVGPEGMHKKKDFDHWIQLCLEYNPKAKATKKKKK